MTVKCKICGIEKDMSIVEHLKHSHNMTTSEYKKNHNDSPVKSHEYSKKQSERMVKNWENDEYRNKLSKIHKESHNKPEFKKKMSEKLKKKYNDNPELFSGITNYHKTDKFKEWVNSDERKEKISKSSKDRWRDDDYRNKVIKSLLFKLSDGRCKKNIEFKYKMSEIISNKYANGEIRNNVNKFNNGMFLSKNGENFYYSSSYELLSMEFFDTTMFVKTWTNKHGIKIKYQYNGMLRNYIPDFLVELIDGSTYIIEMKGWETEEVLIKKQYAETKYDNYLIFYCVNDLKKFINEKCKNIKR